MMRLAAPARSLAASLLAARQFSSRRRLPEPPLLPECDLVESFARGDGAGGRAVAATANCVRLTHAPTGARVRCHATRSLEDNRRLARRALARIVDARASAAGASSPRAAAAAAAARAAARSHSRAAKRHAGIRAARLAATEATAAAAAAAAPGGEKEQPAASALR